jgi:lipopolysaccharide/colanic/teichoic acid biosynthesis glycosyltransferase
MPPAHAAALPPEQLSVLLSVRPGITDPAAIHFLAEDAVLAGQDDAETLYLQWFLPVKARMQIESLQRRSLTADLRVATRTLALLWSRRARDESALAMREILKTARAASPA